MQESILSDFAIIGMKITSSNTFVDIKEMDVDDVKQQKYEMLEYYSPNQTEMPQYLSNLSVMCFVPPVHIYSDQLVPLQQHRPSDNFRSKRVQANSKDYLHQFVLTDNMAEKRYCTSLVVYEKVTVFQSSEQPDIDSQLSFTGGREDVYVPYSYCLVSNHSYLQSQKKIMMALYKGWLESPIREKRRYLQMSLDVQNSLYSSRSKKDTVTKVPIFESLEFVLSILFSIPVNFRPLRNLRLTITPQEQANRQEPQKIHLVSFPPSFNDVRFQLMDVEYRYIFSRLSIKNIMRVIQALLLEKQVMIFTENVWELASICETLLCFIKPFRWRCLYIPYLPVQLLETFHATIPYIIGIHSDQKSKVLGQVDYQDKIMVHLNEDRVVGPSQELPEYISKNLEREIKQIKLDLNKPNCNVDEFQVLQFKHILFKHVTQLINNCIPYFTYSETGQDFQQITEIFQLDQYIQIFAAEDYIFYDEFIRTMMFSRFVEDSYKILYETEFKQSSNYSIESDLGCFLSSIKRLGQKSFYNILENKPLYSLIQVEFDTRFKAYAEQLKATQDIECGDFYGHYKRKGQSIGFPLIRISKDLIVKIPEIFEQKPKPKPPFRSKTEFVNIQSQRASSNIKDNLLPADETKKPINFPQQLVMCICPSLGIKQSTTLTPPDIFFYPKIKRNKRRLKSLFTVSHFHIAKKENINHSGGKKWIQDLKQHRAKHEDSDQKIVSDFAKPPPRSYQPVEKIDLFEKLFNETPSTPTTPQKGDAIPKIFAKSTSKKIFARNLSSAKALR